MTMPTSKRVQHAIEIASVAHRGQVNKANEPYILHPMRVMDRVDSTDEKIVAICMML
jgi:GTP diphosphokinase / guanosine-3',5'-bis(diphosphate) 3'-diphosphatase